MLRVPRYSVTRFMVGARQVRRRETRLRAASTRDAGGTATRIGVHPGATRRTSRRDDDFSGVANQQQNNRFFRRHYLFNQQFTASVLPVNLAQQ